jgi:hypothetical protein
MVVAVGESEDGTLDLIKGIASDKIRILKTKWDDSLREGGKVLAQETNKAFQAVSPDSDWAFYIQADEVMHEKYIHTVHDAMVQYKDDPEVDGLLFNYLHFYGSYDYVGESYRWYRREIRTVRKRDDIFSYHDAQGFRKKPNEKLCVKPIDAWMYHYGWVKDPRKMQKKQEDFNKLWRDDAWVERNVAKAEEFDYGKVDSLRLFDGTHPQVMNERIQKINWKFDYDISRNRYSTKEKVKRLVYKATGIRLGEYQNFKII